MEDSISRTDDESPVWPRGLLATLAVLGVFKGRPINSSATCLLCSPKCDELFPSKDEDDTSSARHKDSDVNDNVLFADSQTTGEQAGRKCAVCLSLMWNADGTVVSDTAKAVPGWLNSRQVGVFSFLSIALYSAFCGGTIAWYTFEFWGQIKDVTHFVSFVAYASVLFTVAATCTVFICLQHVRRSSQASDDRLCGVLETGYIARRVRCLASRRFPLQASAFLLLSLTWAGCNVSMQLATIVGFMNSTSLHASNVSSEYTTLGNQVGLHLFKYVKTELGFVIAFVGFLIYVSFWHYTLVVRIALAAEMNLVLVFINQNEGRLDSCRHRILATHREYHLLRRLLTGLMPFIVATSVMGIAVHVSWNYNVYSQDDTKVASNNLLINIMIFSEKFMVLALPLFAVGGLNVHHVWRQFAHSLSRQRSQDHDEFWERLVQFTAELEPEFSDIDLAIFLSVVSLYVGRNLGWQRVDYHTDGLF